MWVSKTHKIWKLPHWIWLTSCTGWPLHHNPKMVKIMKKQLKCIAQMASTLNTVSTGKMLECSHHTISACCQWVVEQRYSGILSYKCHKGSWKLWQKQALSHSTPCVFSILKSWWAHFKSVDNFHRKSIGSILVLNASVWSLYVKVFSWHHIIFWAFWIRQTKVLNV